MIVCGFIANGLLSQQLINIALGLELIFWYSVERSSFKVAKAPRLN